MWRGADGVRWSTDLDIYGFTSSTNASEYRYYFGDNPEYCYQGCRELTIGRYCYCGKAFDESERNHAHDLALLNVLHCAGMLTLHD